eukprot:TRINITY_DN2471_c0_g1_i2.p1 TRINITY_DN2471_c0_g1~~TRINITY_DN2471_c0_g1_i2.p1  ORF type:complete len:498 (-),score=72.24 TRINITY_DN2471_c0_g1_i2:22-1515(-)
MKFRAASLVGGLLFVLFIGFGNALFTPTPVGGYRPLDRNAQKGEGNLEIISMRKQGFSAKDIREKLRVEYKPEHFGEGGGAGSGVWPPVAFSGYVNVNETFGANLFFYFFQAQNGNLSAPIILWLQGGPGCPSLLGLLLENGPFYVTEELKLIRDPFSWNNEYNMLFIDQPAGVGFSYIENPDGFATNEQEVANALHTGLVEFFSIFSAYRQNDFYVFGESYGGKYVPAIAYKIVQSNDAITSGKTPNPVPAGHTAPFVINLAGIGIGDGLTDPLVQATGYYHFAYSAGLVDEKQLITVNKTVNTAINLILKEDWPNAANAFGNIFETIRTFSGEPNPLDYRTYKEYNFTIVGDYFNQDYVRKMLHVGSHTFKGASCNDPAGIALGDDIAKSVKSLFPTLLKRMKVLLYNGQFDLEIALTTSEAWIKTIPWPGQGGYLDATRYVWKNAEKEVAGFARTFDTLTQVIVVGAGHMVPLNQPANAYYLICLLYTSDAADE